MGHNFSIIPRSVHLTPFISTFPRCAFHACIGIPRVRSQLKATAANQIRTCSSGAGTKLNDGGAAMVGNAIPWEGKNEHLLYSYRGTILKAGRCANLRCLLRTCLLILCWVFARPPNLVLWNGGAWTDLFGYSPFLIFE